MGHIYINIREKSSLKQYVDFRDENAQVDVRILVALNGIHAPNSIIKHLQNFDEPG